MSVFRVKLTQGDTRTGDGSMDTVSQLSGTITAASNASPIVITCASHGLSTGRKVHVKSVAGNTAANGNWTITVLTSSTFSLNGSTGNSAYTSGGIWESDSVQRTMYVPGPNLKNRKLTDGDEFTDCNYWKKFTYPTLPYSQAFIEVITDDGGTWVDGSTSASNYPYVYNFTLSSGETYADNTANVLSDTGSVATEAMVTVTGDDVNCRINGLTTAVISIAAGTTFTIDNMDINKLEFSNDDSGASTATVEVLFTVKLSCNS